MYPENLKRNLNYKLRELELIVKQISHDPEPSNIDIDLALEKIRHLYDLLRTLKAGESQAAAGKERQSVPTGKPVVPSDPDPVEDDNIYEAEGIIPSPSGYMKKEETEADPPRNRLRSKESGGLAARSSREAEDTESGQGSAEKKLPAENDPIEAGQGSAEKKPSAENDPIEAGQGSAEKKPSAESDPIGSGQGSAEKKPPAESDPIGSGQGSGEKKAPGAGEDPVAGKADKAGQNSDRSSDISIVADKYLSSQNYINQAIAGKKTQKDLSARMHSRPISDLRNSIGLNDKFLFIKEIFKGRPEKYNEFIDDLNKAGSYDEALNLTTSKYSLDQKNEVVKKLLDLVKRKNQAI